MSYTSDYKDCLNVHNPGSFLTFFKVPMDYRKGIWIKHSGNIYLNIWPKKHIYFCEEHFFESDITPYSNRKCLNRNAIPKVHDERICCCKEDNIDPICRNTLEKEKLIQNQSKQNKASSSAGKRSAHDAMLWDSDEELVVKKSATDKTYLRDYKISAHPETTDVEEWQFPSPSKPKSQEEDLRTRKVPKYVYTSSKATIKTKTHEIDVLDKLLSGKSENVVTFVKSQLLHKSFGKWSQKEKQLAIKYYYLSPALYRHMLKTGFSLPSIATIMKWHSMLRFDTGLSSILMEMLKNKFQELNELNRKGILMFDEMATKRELEYNSKDDFVYGFTDISCLGRENKVSSSVMLFMIRGLNQNWKQAISYMVGPLSAENLCKVLQEDIPKLLQTGCDLVGITCDQAATNRSCYKKLGITIENPFIFIEGKKIYAFYDIPHLFKSIRNCLYVNDIIVDGNTVSWAIIRDVYNFDNGKIRAMYKLTDIHIDPKNFDRMSVKVATHVLSHSVASAILTAVGLGCFEGEKKQVALNTAHFISTLNTLFDNLNSVMKYSKNPSRNALSLENDILGNLKEAKNYIRSWEHKGRMKRPFCFDGLLQTITAIEMLWEDLKDKQKYIITSHLHQDALENMISMIRGFKGTYERNPSVYRIYRNLKQIMFQNSTPSEYSNYVDCEARNLINLQTINENEEAFDKEASSSNYDELEENIAIEEYSEIFDDVFSSSTPQEKLKSNSVLYFFGYMSKKVTTRMKCAACKAHVINLKFRINIC